MPPSLDSREASVQIVLAILDHTDALLDLNADLARMADGSSSRPIPIRFLRPFEETAAAIIAGLRR